MDPLVKKTHTTPRDLTYTYYIHTTPNNTRPTLVLCHGWPDEARLWFQLISALIPLGYSIIAPDMLGYGGTSKPTEVEKYNNEDMCSDLCSILDVENVEKVVLIGHDWGAMFPARFHMYHPSRVSGAVFMAVGPGIPGPFDLDATIAFLTKTFGKPLMAYWKLFTAPDGPSLLERKASSLFDCIHARDTDGFAEYFTVEDGLRKYLENDTHEPTAEYAGPEAKAAFVARMQHDGFTGPLNWYQARLRNVHWEHEKKIDPQRYVFDFPVLFVACSRDAVCRPEAINACKNAGHLPDLTISTIDSKHWVMMEKPKDLEQAVTGWLGEKF